MARKLHLPALAGKVVMGMLLGEAGLKILTHESQSAFHAFSTFALSMVAVTVGGHLEFRRLHNAKTRILLISICQTTVTFFLVFIGFTLFNPLGLNDKYQLPVHLIMASLGTATSPISILHIIKEKRAKGLLVKTAIAVIGINNLLTITIFEICRAVGDTLLAPEHSLSTTLLNAGLSVGITLLIGLGSGLVFSQTCHLMMRRLRQSNPSRHQVHMFQAGVFTSLVVAICFCSGLCDFLNQHFKHWIGEPWHIHSLPVLANMVLGLVLANRSSFKEEVLEHFDTIEHTIFTCFFVLAGAHFTLVAADKALPAAGIYLATVILGKAGGGYMGARFSRSTQKLSINISRVLLIQAGLAIGLLISLDGAPDFPLDENDHLIEVLATCLILTSITSEIFGGLLLSRTLDKTGEAGQNRTRLIEFLKEEYIIPRLKAWDKWDALKELSYYMAKLHNMDVTPEEIYTAVCNREKEMSTAMGEGIAVPHARITDGNEIYGVLATLEKPLDFDSIDGKPVSLVVMVATPKELAHKHLQVMSTIAAMMQQESIRTAILKAPTAEEINDVIESEEAETFNYFLET